jgi:hypothetical protein
MDIENKTEANQEAWWTAFNEWTYPNSADYMPHPQDSFKAGYSAAATPLLEEIADYRALLDEILLEATQDHPCEARISLAIVKEKLADYKHGPMPYSVQGKLKKELDRLKKELELKDTWVKHHRDVSEIDAQKKHDAEKELEVTKQRLEEAEKVIGFYADTENWLEPDGLDGDYLQIKDDQRHHYGGFRAREYFKEKEA